VVVRTLWTEDRLSYDISGRALRVALGALLETIDVAASEVGLQASGRVREGSEDQPVVDVSFEDRPGGDPHPLLPFIRTRATQRRPLSRRPLTAHARRELEAAVTAPLELRWLDGSDRMRVARLLSLAGKIRLTIPETHRVHQRVIEWNARDSADRIPDQAIGTDALTTRVVRWALGAWWRAHFLNRFMAGTLIPRLELDLLPGRQCAAHFVIARASGNVDWADEIEAGRALQRVWLTATRLGIRLQPEFAPLIFAEYGRRSTAFTRDAAALRDARRLAAQIDAVVGPVLVSRAVVLARVGYGPEPSARSLRRPLSDLLERTPPEAPPEDARASQPAVTV
jgi:hypothetical protein